MIRDGDLDETPPVQSRLDGEEKAGGRVIFKDVLFRP